MAVAVLLESGERIFVLGRDPFGILDALMVSLERLVVLDESAIVFITHLTLLIHEFFRFDQKPFTSKDILVFEYIPKSLVSFDQIFFAHGSSLGFQVVNLGTLSFSFIFPPCIVFLSCNGTSFGPEVWIFKYLSQLFVECIWGEDDFPGL